MGQNRSFWKRLELRCGDKVSQVRRSRGSEGRKAPPPCNLVVSRLWLARPAMPTIAELVVQSLKNAGTPRVFGVPGGGSSLELVEAARAGGLPFILVHQESAACTMAAVTGELTGRPGAALATLGPGAASAANGLAYASLDRAPMIFLTDRHPQAALEFTTHQTIDHAALFAPVSRKSLVLTPDSALEAIQLALRLSLEEPRGPVHLDLPSDLAGQSARTQAIEVSPASSPLPDSRLLEEAAKLLTTSRRPVLIAGLECRGLEEAKLLRDLAESSPMPVLTTYKAKGILPETHPLALGVFTGAVWEEAVVGSADLIVTVGLDPVELIPRAWPYSAPVVQLSRIHHSSRYFTPRLEVLGDLELILDALAPRLGSHKADWDLSQIERLKRSQRARLAIPTSGLAPHRVIEILRSLSPASTIATVDSGAHMFPATTFWEADEPASFLISNGLATMGFALPAAVAAQLVHPERRVVCLTGDGGLMMVASELETVRRLDLPIVVVVFNDGALSLIRAKQVQRGYDQAATKYSGPDFEAMARSFGLASFRAVNEPELHQAFREALAAQEPALVDAHIDASAYPRVLEAIRGAPRKE